MPAFHPSSVDQMSKKSAISESTFSKNAAKTLSTTLLRQEILHINFTKKNLIKLENLLKAVVHWCYIKKAVLNNFAKFTGKQLCRVLLFLISYRLIDSYFTKKVTQYKCFLVNTAKVLRAAFSTEHPRGTASNLFNITFSNCLSVFNSTFGL